LNIADYLVISAVNLVFIIVGHSLAKPWLDKRFNKALNQPPAPAPEKKE